MDATREALHQLRIAVTPAALRAFAFFKAAAAQIGLCLIRLADAASPHLFHLLHLLHTRLRSLVTHAFSPAVLLAVPRCCFQLVSTLSHILITLLTIAVALASVVSARVLLLAFAVVNTLFAIVAHVASHPTITLYIRPLCTASLFALLLGAFLGGLAGGTILTIRFFLPPSSAGSTGSGSSSRRETYPVLPTKRAETRITTTNFQQHAPLKPTTPAPALRTPSAMASPRKSATKRPSVTFSDPLTVPDSPPRRPPTEASYSVSEKITTPVLPSPQSTKAATIATATTSVVEKQPIQLPSFSVKISSADAPADGPATVVFSFSDPPSPRLADMDDAHTTLKATATTRLRPRHHVSLPASPRAEAAPDRATSNSSNDHIKQLMRPPSASDSNLVRLKSTATTFPSAGLHEEYKKNTAVLLESATRSLRQVS